MRLQGQFGPKKGWAVTALVIWWCWPGLYVGVSLVQRANLSSLLGGPKWVNRLDSSDDCGCDTSWGTLLKKGRRKLRIRDYYEGSARKTIERERETQESGQSRQCKVVAGSAQQSDDCDLLSRPNVVNCGGRGKNRPGSGRG